MNYYDLKSLKKLRLERRVDWPKSGGGTLGRAEQGSFVPLGFAFHRQSVRQIDFLCHAVKLKALYRAWAF